MFFTLHCKQIKFVRSFLGIIYGAPICFLVLSDLYIIRPSLVDVGEIGSADSKQLPWFFDLISSGFYYINTNVLVSR